MSAARSLVVVRLVWFLLLSTLSVSVSSQWGPPPSPVYLHSSTLYSFESPTFSTSAPGCGLSFAYCNFRYSTDLPAPTDAQPWTWSTGGIAHQASAWDPAGPAGSSPPNGAQFAFLQATTASPNSSMLAQASLNLGRAYYVQYSIAARGGNQGGTVIDPSTQFNVTYNDGTKPVVISSPSPYTGLQWPAASNPIQSDLFLATSTGILQFTMSVSNTNYFDQAVVVDAVSIFGVAIGPDETLSFDVPALASGGYQYSPAQAFGQPTLWTNGGIAHSGSPWDPLGIVPDQYSFIQTNGIPGKFTSSMRVWVSGLSPGTPYTVSWQGATRAGYTPLDQSTLTVLFSWTNGTDSTMPHTSNRLWTKSTGLPYSSSFTSFNSIAPLAAQTAEALLVFAMDSPTSGTYDCGWLIDAITIAPYQY